MLFINQLSLGRRVRGKLVNEYRVRFGEYSLKVAKEIVGSIGIWMNNRRVEQERSTP